MALGQVKTRSQTLFAIISQGQEDRILLRLFRNDIALAFAIQY